MSAKAMLGERSRGFTEEQTSMREVLRRFLGEHAPEERVRATMGSEEYDRELWRHLADAFGAQAMFLPAERGGAGLGPVEALVLAEELGRCLAVVPYGTAVTEALTFLSFAAPDDELVAELATGRQTAVLIGDLRDESRSAIRLDGQGRLHGTIPQTPHAGSADVLLVIADSENGDQLRVANVMADGLRIDPLPTFDETRPRARVSLDGVVSRAPTLVAPLPEACTRAGQRSQLHAAGEAVGGAGRCLEMTVDYVRVREQFGQEIARFQAVKHACAEMLVQLEGARAIALRAAHELAARSDRAQLWLDVARLHTAKAFDAIAAETVHLHGGIGFTWEHPAHLYVKRAMSLADPGALRAPRERTASAFLDAPSQPIAESSDARLGLDGPPALATDQEGGR